MKILALNNRIIDTPYASCFFAVLTYNELGLFITPNTFKNGLVSRFFNPNTDYVSDTRTGFSGDNAYRDCLIAALIRRRQAAAQLSYHEMIEIGGVL